ncbi:MAG: ABC transporter ATP-binding protein [uncultured bacterium]|nr:MAG: ABC transporter ATP-binding protein [uncultured bacterium]OGT45881.1 MAG: hypothetical protein A3E82_08795 [Gammaproteobacteria bacterium RIFCSPHIGHO2_12_FULL_38_11]
MTQTLTLHDIGKSFSGKVLYHQLSYTFHTGCYVITGPNGIGKTVLMEMLAGIFQPDVGSIVLNGMDHPDSYAYKKQLTYIPSKPTFFPTTTGKDFFNLMLSIKNKQLMHAAQDCAERFNLLPFFDTPFEQLSFGTQKKFFLTMLAMHGTNGIVLLDEPTNALDESANLFLYPTIQSLAKHAIVIIITHDQLCLNHLNAIPLAIQKTPLTAF